MNTNSKSKHSAIMDEIWKLEADELLTDDMLYELEMEFKCLIPSNIGRIKNTVIKWIFNYIH